MRRWAGGIDNNIAALKKGDDKVRQRHRRDGGGDSAARTTPAREAESGRAKDPIDRANCDARGCQARGARRAGCRRSVAEKPWPQKLGDAAESVEDAMASPTTYVPVAGILRTGGKLAEAADHAADAAGAVAKRGAKAAAKRSGTAAVGEVAEHTDEAAARGLLKEARGRGQTTR